ncbi:MAG: hypothetical protein JXA14_02340 [Anaerolineae bacterium]|nr:hypothetical protein [Anaerolineae bacterium]
MQAQEASHEIGTLNEKSLHAALKEWYAQPGDQFEVFVDGFVVDIVRGDLLIEIQTGNFSSIKRKMRALVRDHPVRLVYPIAREKWIVRLARDGSGGILGRRKSPKRGALEYVFGELVSFPRLLVSPNFSLEVLLIQEEEIRRYDGKRGWRRHGWVIQERRLLDVVGWRLFETPNDLAVFIPSDLAEPWTTADLAAAIGQPRWLARKMAYCLRKMGVVEVVGKQGNAILYGGSDWQSDLRP